MHVCFSHGLEASAAFRWASWCIIVRTSYAIPRRYSEHLKAEVSNIEALRVLTDSIV